MTTSLFMSGEYLREPQHYRVRYLEGPRLNAEAFADAILPNVYAAVAGLTEGPEVYLKLEGLNVAGSIKLKPAIRMVAALEEQGLLRKGGHLIESSSGNLGTALSIIAACRGYKFTCITDPVCSSATKLQMRANGAEVITVEKRDEAGGFLGTRIRLIKEMLASDPDLIWTNQYANRHNWISHFETTAPEILLTFPFIDWLFVGAGTCGTLLGCLRYFKERSPDTRVVAVDAIGSTTFGAPAGKRHIPGLGTSQTPELLNRSEVPEVSFANERDAVLTCHRLAASGLLVGGSTGSVLSAIYSRRKEFAKGDVIVAISADLGLKYLDTVYNVEWCNSHYGI